MSARYFLMIALFAIALAWWLAPPPDPPKRDIGIKNTYDEFDRVRFRDAHEARGDY